MARVIYSAAALDDLERLADFLRTVEADAPAALERILSCLELLEHNPELGRADRHGLRELVISRGRTGYLALYRHEPRRELVRVLRVRHQREAGYRG